MSSTSVGLSPSLIQCGTKFGKFPKDNESLVSSVRNLPGRFGPYWRKRGRSGLDRREGREVRRGQCEEEGVISGLERARRGFEE